MEFRRSGQSNQRRRRVLKDDPAAAGDDGASDGGKRRSRTPLRQYSDHALAEHQLRVTDLIPQRPWTFLVLLLSGLLAIVTVQTLFLYHADAEQWLGRDYLAAFNPTRTGSVAGWVSSMLLGLTAVCGMLVFSLRRHKIDDYRGRYRVWLPLTGLFLLASLDSSTGLHRAGRGLVDLIAQRWGEGTSLGAHPHFWWVTLCFAGVVLVAGRLAVEMRQSRAAIGKLLLAFGCYLGLALLEWQVWSVGLADLMIVAASGARLLGDLCLCLATMTYARYVYLDAQGIIAARRLAREKRKRQAQAEKLARKEAAKAAKQAAAEASKAAKTAKTKADETEDESEEEADESHDEAETTAAKPAAAPAKSTDQRPATPAPTAKPGPLAGRGSPPPNADDADEDDEDDDDDSQMSRAERRRMKKMQRREARKAA